MKAIVNEKYGPPDILELREMEKPVPKEDEVLVRVHAASVNAADWHILRGQPFLVRFMGYGLTKPKNKIRGTDVAGRVEAVGANVTKFRPGDEVFGYCRGSFAEFVCSSESTLDVKPDNVTFEQAASVPVAAFTALQALRDTGRIQSGQKVLVDGAGGGVGTFAVQIAKFFGTEVAAVCSTQNQGIARSIGADHVIDYTQEDFTRNGQQYDLILAANGYHSMFDYMRALSPKGIFVMAGGSMALMFQLTFLGPMVSMTGNKKMRGMMAKLSKSDLAFMKTLVESGKVVPVIDRCYPLREAAEAIRYLEKGHARGKVVITM